MKHAIFYTLRVLCDDNAETDEKFRPAHSEPTKEVCGAEDLTGHGPFGSVSGDVSLLVRYARVSLEIWLGLAWP